MSDSRRKFLKAVGLGSLAFFFLSSCQKLGLSGKKKFKGNVIIIGGGAAGIYAGYLLKELGIEFTILEASDKMGGRMGKLTGFSDYPIDLGAQWMHGHQSIVGEMVELFQADVALDDTEYMYWFENELIPTLPKSVDIFDKDGLPDVSFADYSIQKGLSPSYLPIIESLAGDYGADASDLSARWVYEEEQNGSSGEGDYKFKETFYDLIFSNFGAQVANNVTVNSIVNTIDYSSNKVLVSTNSGQQFSADKVLITVPITILQSNDISFVPPLPVNKTTAFSKIGMGAGMKVFMKFSSHFFADNIYGGAVCAAYFNDAIGKNTADHVLIAFVMGQQAEALSAMNSDQSIINALLAELDAMYNGQASNTFLGAFVQDYFKAPFIRGAYSYSKVGMNKNTRAIAAESVNSCLFFGGEAMNLNGHHQTVHGAIETAYREVMKIMKEA